MSKVVRRRNYIPGRSLVRQAYGRWQHDAAVSSFRFGRGGLLQFMVRFRFRSQNLCQCAVPVVLLPGNPLGAWLSLADAWTVLGYCLTSATGQRTAAEWPVWRTTIKTLLGI